MVIDVTIEVKPLEFLAVDNPVWPGEKKFKAVTPFGIFAVVGDPHRWSWNFTTTEGVLVDMSRSSYRSSEQACFQANRWWRERIGPLVQLKTGLKHA